MMRLIRSFRLILAPTLFLAFAAGCSSKSGSVEEQLIYRDQRLVTTRPATDDEAEPDVVVRVERLDIPCGSLSAKQNMPAVDDIPADATVALAAEALASYETPFYSTVERPRGRVEIGGHVARAGNDGYLRVSIGFGENGPGVVNQINSNVMIRSGERHVVSCTSEGAPAAWIRSVTVLRVMPYEPRQVRAGR